MSKKTILISLFFIVFFSFLITKFTTYRIEGHSMYPTLNANNRVIGYKTKNIKRGDIISFQKKDQQVAIKRVIGLPNETIEILEDGTVIIDGKIVDEPYLKNKNIKQIEISFPYKIPEGEYFVLGDNREDSFDSKNFKVGTIKPEEIKSKIIFCLNSFKKY